MPKLPPPPRTAQYRSGFSSALAWRSWPSAVTMSTDFTLSSARPKRRATRPKPPPSVRPPTPGVGHGAGRRHEAVRHRLVIQVPQQAAAFDVGPTRGRVDAHAAQPRQVDLYAAVAGGLAREAVATALHGDEQLALARKGDRAPDIRGAGRLHDERRVLVELRMQDAARRVVALVSCEQERPAQARLELGNRRLLNDRRRAVELDRGEAARGL